MTEMTVTEDQAKTKLCPFEGCGTMVMINDASFPENQLWERRCVASGCMAWGWYYDRNGTLMPTTGYCIKLKEKTQ
jgi:hypothetical protein